MVIQSIYNYAIHLLSGLAMVGVFVALYLRVTPFCELTLIRRGCVAALLSLGGATLGFSLTVASSILFNTSFVMFLVWGISAMLVQLLTYVIVSRALPHMNEALETNNVAMGGLMGLIAVVVGIVNAACLS
ncbi:DUF350 domain-containing protein [Uliginosibacterium sp. H1]|uniref:DUF350 domain-containing protein n=1 Tax=Uliginosibacterium sp. H1 TaxID=3114757 RepID=UPI002E171790|nr:DUF350 domain-containing protein [Uliginosibacterium sp. H1]